MNTPDSVLIVNPIEIASRPIQEAGEGVLVIGTDLPIGAQMLPPATGGQNPRLAITILQPISSEDRSNLFDSLANLSGCYPDLKIQVDDPYTPDAVSTDG